jgi:hypothetical protein
MGTGPAAVITSAFGKRGKGKRRSIIPRRRKRSGIGQVVNRVTSLGGRKKRRRPELTTVLEGVGTLVGAAVTGAQVVSELRRSGQQGETDQPAERPAPASNGSRRSPRGADEPTRRAGSRGN